MAAGDSLEKWISSTRAAAEDHERKARYLRESLAWKQAGLLGERAVARELEPLGKVGWRVLHDRAVPGSSANIDHLLVGPPGVVVIDTKAHRGPLGVGANGVHVGGRAFGEKLDKLARYTRTVQAASARPVTIYSLVCFTERVGLDQPGQVGTATLLEMRHLVSWLQRLPAALAPRQVWDLAELIERTHPDRVAPAVAARPVSSAAARDQAEVPRHAPRSLTSSRRLRPRRSSTGRSDKGRTGARTSAARRLVALLALLAALGVAHQHLEAGTAAGGAGQPPRIVSTH